MSVYNPYLKDKAKAFFGERGERDPNLIRQLVEESGKKCTQYEAMSSDKSE